MGTTAGTAPARERRIREHRGGNEAVELASNSLPYLRDLPRRYWEGFLQRELISLFHTEAEVRLPPDRGRE